MILALTFKGRSSFKPLLLDNRNRVAKIMHITKKKASALNMAEPLEVSERINCGINRTKPSFDNSAPNSTFLPRPLRPQSEIKADMYTKK